MTAAVYAIATMDTKGDELAYVAHCMRRLGVAAKLIDVSTLGGPIVQPNVTRDQVLKRLRKAHAHLRRNVSPSISVHIFTCRGFIETVVAPAVGADRPVIVLGTSVGGAVALDFALHHPEVCLVTAADYL